MDLNVRMTTASATLGQHSFGRGGIVCRSRFNRPALKVLKAKDLKQGATLTKQLGLEKNMVYLLLGVFIVISQFFPPIYLCLLGYSRDPLEGSSYRGF